jgi:hypothetical protein
MRASWKSQISSYIKTIMLKPEEVPPPPKAEDGPPPVVTGEDVEKIEDALEQDLKAAETPVPETVAEPAEEPPPPVPTPEPVETGEAKAEEAEPEAAGTAEDKRKRKARNQKNYILRKKTKEAADAGPTKGEN